MQKTTYTKQEAIQLLGGSVRSAAKAIGCTYQAVSKWPPMLSARVSDRVFSASVRLGNDANLIGQQSSRQAP